MEFYFLCRKPLLPPSLSDNIPLHIDCTADIWLTGMLSLRGGEMSRGEPYELSASG